MLTTSACLTPVPCALNADPRTHKHLKSDHRTKDRYYPHANAPIGARAHHTRLACAPHQAHASLRTAQVQRFQPVQRRRKRHNIEGACDNRHRGTCMRQLCERRDRKHGSRTVQLENDARPQCIRGAVTQLHQPRSSVPTSVGLFFRAQRERGVSGCPIVARCCCSCRLAQCVESTRHCLRGSLSSQKHAARFRYGLARHVKIITRHWRQVTISHKGCSPPLVGCSSCL